MASFLLDEQISPSVAAQLVRHDRQIRIQSMHEWRAGAFLGTEDEIVLREAYIDRLTLITFDLSTIAPLLKQWGEEGRSHGGIILIDDKSIATNDFGGMVRAISSIWERLKDMDFTDGVVFLRA